MYEEIKPSNHLRESVDSIWVYSDNKYSEEFKVLPDACTDLIFDLNLGKVFLSGAMSNYQMVSLPAQSNIIGIRFKSENFGSLIGAPLHEVKNVTIELSELHTNFDTNIISCLKHSDPTRKKINKLEDSILAALKLNNEKRDHLIISVANTIRSSKGKLNIQELAKSYHISLRQLQRRFKEFIGLTIKEFSNIIRFKNTQRFIKANSELSLMEIAFNSGFYNHSHLNYEFNRIAGENPSHYR